MLSEGGAFYDSPLLTTVGHDDNRDGTFTTWFSQRPRQRSQRVQRVQKPEKYVPTPEQIAEMMYVDISNGELDESFISDADDTISSSI